MPIFSSKSVDGNKKALERKMYLARECPDEIFDLSNCELRKVPEGTFSLVKVLMKTHLYLQHNVLRSLDSGGKLSDLRGVQVLNLSSNELSSVSSGLVQLSALRELNLCNNRISIFPVSVFQLRCLTYLNMEDNQLTSVPPDIGQMEQLVTLLLSKNPFVDLPKELVRLTKLERLTVPLENMRTPPTCVCELGLSAIFRYFNSDGPNAAPCLDARSTASASSETLVAANVDSLSRSLQHDQKSCHLSSQELQLQLDQSLQAQAELTSKAQAYRKKALQYLVEEGSRLNEDLALLQRKREADRVSFLHSLITEEDKAAELVCHLLKRNASRRLELHTDPTRWMLLEEPDSSFKLRRQEVLSSMESMLSAADQAFRDYLSQRQSTNQRILDTGNSATGALERALVERAHKQKQLVTLLSIEDDVQKKAFAEFQSRCDSQSQLLRQDIELIEQELLRLTNIELQRKSERGEVNLQCLAERRSDLVQLLARLGAEQERRQQELRNRLLELELRRSEEQRDYWLIQYQRLLDHMSSVPPAELDSDVYDVLVASDALHFVPNFRYHRVNFSSLSSMTDEDLQKIGINASGVRRCILDSVEQRLLTKKLSYASLAAFKPSSDDAPSAPPVQQDDRIASDTATDSILPSAPPLDVVARVEHECCVCQEAKCLVIFLQCGHVCTCTACGEKLSICPLCRSPISQRIQIHFPSVSEYT